MLATPRCVVEDILVDINDIAAGDMRVGSTPKESAADIAKCLT